MKKEFVRIDNFELRKEAQDIGADLRMVKIFSAKLGQISKGIDSFFHRICREVLNSSPAGIKFGEMRIFDRSNQQCQIQYEGGMGWDDKLWPLE